MSFLSASLGEQLLRQYAELEVIELLAALAELRSAVDSAYSASCSMDEDRFLAAMGQVYFAARRLTHPGEWS